ncbi:MAG: hypothetical protein GC178_00590 [Flavobacteriales bacterium]|nr:hypothetical protein [Flavobacteriales bacterium]
MGFPTLSGSDYFHLLVDRKMLRNGLVGNISRIQLELEANADLSSIAEQLSQNETLRQVTELKVVFRWPLPAKWVTERRKKEPVQVSIGLSENEFEQTVLNRKVDNENGLVHIDLCELKTGTKHMVVSMHHVLFDHQGMVNFIHALADETVQLPLFPEKEERPFMRLLSNFHYMTVYMLSRSSGKLGTLVMPKLKPRSHAKYRMIEFSEDETKQVEERAWKAGSRIGQSAFYMAAVSRVVNQTLHDRNEQPPYLWFSIPNNQRRKGSVGHLVSNQLSFLFFRLNSNELNTTEEAVSSINHQLKAQIKDRIAERYTDLMHAMRIIPMPVYEAMVNLASNGKMSSFGFSDLGTDKIQLKELLGAKILKLHHYPPAPSPPGFNVVVSKADGKLKFVWAYFDEVLSSDEQKLMKNRFCEYLLRAS